MTYRIGKFVNDVSADTKQIKKTYSNVTKKNGNVTKREKRERTMNREKEKEKEHEQGKEKGT